jgi:hypothetical protein
MGRTHIVMYVGSAPPKGIAVMAHYLSKARVAVLLRALEAGRHDLLTMEEEREKERLVEALTLLSEGMD